MPRPKSPDARRRAFVERMGLAAESDGLSRIAGRLFGELLLSSDPLSLDQLAARLGVSKASVSTDGRRLIQRGIVERVGLPGDRRDYYQLAPDFFTVIIRDRLDRWSLIHDLVVDMSAGSPQQPAVVRDRFSYIDNVHDFVLARVEDALAQWSARHDGHQSRLPLQSARKPRPHRAAAPSSK